MSAFGNKRLILDKYKDLPKVNGCTINSIYGRMETAYRTDQILTDAYGHKPDYYLLCTDDVADFKTWKKKPNLKVKELPKELAALFGEQVINGKKTFISRMWFRTSDSGHGGFTDQTADFNGGDRDMGASYYRTKRWKDAHESCIFEGEEGFSKKIEAVLGKSFKAEVLPEWYDVEYPVSYIRNEGGLNYPDTKLSGWRRSYDMPYVRNQHDRNHIRVFIESLNAHVYLEAIKDNDLQEGDTDLVQVQFSRDSKSDQFCNVVCWAESKKEAPNQIIRWNVLKKTKKRDKTTEFEIAAMVGEKVQFKQKYLSHQFYRLINFVNI